MNKAKNLIFLHIPKNGGNTLHSILNRLYKKEHTFSIEVVNNVRLNTNDFLAMSEQNRVKIKLLKGHMLFGLHKHLIGDSEYITFLRNPQDRIVSFYNYVIKRPNHRLYKFITENNYNLYDFVINAQEGDVHNAQIRWISGLEHGTQEEMLKKAQENIKNHFSFIGLQEKFNHSLVCLSTIYHWGVPYYTYQNKGSYKKERLIDAKTIKAIAERNKGDLLLYQQIEKKFNQKFNSEYRNFFKLRQLNLVNYLIKKPVLKRLYLKLKSFKKKFSNGFNYFK